MENSSARIRASALIAALVAWTPLRAQELTALTDTDNTDETATAWYGDIAFERAAKPTD